MNYNGQIDTTRCKHAVGIQYKHESKEDIAGFISKPVARPEHTKDIIDSSDKPTKPSKYTI